jgi:hypothetical protein
MALSDEEPLNPNRRKLLESGSIASVAALSMLKSESAGSAPAMESTTSAIIDVRSLGAKGDGHVDDTPAIQRALDRGGRIFFPPGSYRITEELQFRTNGTVLQGSSAGTTRIVGGSANGALISSATKHASTLLWCQLLDLAFVASGPVRSVVDWRSMQFGQINRCWVYGSGADSQAAIDCGALEYGMQECTFNRFQDNYLGNVQYGYRVVDGANANHISGGRAQLEKTGAVGAWFQSRQVNGINGWTIIGFCCEHPGNSMTGLSFAGNVWDMYVAGCRFERLLAGIVIGPGNRRISVLSNAYSSNRRDIVDNGARDDHNMILEAGQVVAPGDAAEVCGVFDGRDGGAVLMRGATVRKTGIGSYLVLLEPPMPSAAYGVLVASDCPVTRYRAISSGQFTISTTSATGAPLDAGPGVTFSIVR